MPVKKAIYLWKKWNFVSESDLQQKNFIKGKNKKKVYWYFLKVEIFFFWFPEKTVFSILSEWVSHNLFRKKNATFARTYIFLLESSESVYTSAAALVIDGYSKMTVITDFIFYLPKCCKAAYYDCRIHLISVGGFKIPKFHRFLLPCFC